MCLEVTIPATPWLLVSISTFKMLMLLLVSSWHELLGSFSVATVTTTTILKTEKINKISTIVRNSHRKLMPHS